MGKLRKGINDLRTINPELAREWDNIKNGSLSPDNVSAGSKKNVWWLCLVCNHSWQAEIRARNRGNGCPMCGTKKSNQSKHKAQLEKGMYTLQNLNPPFLDEWDYEKNGNLKPKDVAAHSGKKVWWKCSKCGYSFLTRIASRTTDNNGCPVCAGVEVASGINDLATINPQLAAQWDVNLNDGLLPADVTANSNRRVWWKCPICGNQWKTMVSVRTSGCGCPKCNKAFHTSYPEQIIFFYLKMHFDDAINSYLPQCLKKGREIDIFIPSLNIGIEYDGFRWHKDTQKDVEKGNLIQSHGIVLIRVREPGLQYVNDGSYFIQVPYIDKGRLYLETVILELAICLNQLTGAIWNPDVNIRRDMYTILSSYLNNKKEYSLASVCPQLLDEWDYTLNESLSPDQVNAHSNYKIWWKCKKCEYVWKATAGDRANGHGCPFCAGSVTRTGFNDIVTMCPQYLDDWAYDKNTDITPENTAYKANYKVWWKCGKCNCYYEQKVADHTRGVGCPVCRGLKIVAGVNDLSTSNPTLAAEWDNAKNEDLTPQSVAPQSNKKVWWICSKCGHSWAAVICSRNGNKRGCPVCGRQSSAEKRRKR